MFFFLLNISGWRIMTYYVCTHICGWWWWYFRSRRAQRRREVGEGSMPVLFVRTIGQIFLSGISPMQKGKGGLSAWNVICNKLVGTIRKRRMLIVYLPVHFPCFMSRPPFTLHYHHRHRHHAFFHTSMLPQVSTFMISHLEPVQVSMYEIHTL